MHTVLNCTKIDPGVSKSFHCIALLEYCVYVHDERCLPQRRRSGPENEGANLGEEGALEVPQKCVCVWGGGGGVAFKTDKQEQVN